MSAVAEAPPVEAEPEKKPVQGQLFEGFRVTEHRLNFGGNVLIVDADVVKAMKLDSGEVELVVRGYVASRKFKGKKDTDGNKVGAEAMSVLIVESVQIYDPDSA